MVWVVAVAGPVRLFFFFLFFFSMFRTPHDFAANTPLPLPLLSLSLPLPLIYCLFSLFCLVALFFALISGPALPCPAFAFPLPHATIASRPRGMRGQSTTD